MFRILMGVMVTGLYISVMTPAKLTFNTGAFVACELYPNNSDYKEKPPSAPLPICACRHRSLCGHSMKPQGAQTVYTMAFMTWPEKAHGSPSTIITSPSRVQGTEILLLLLSQSHCVFATAHPPATTVHILPTRHTCFLLQVSPFLSPLTGGINPGSRVLSFKSGPGADETPWLPFTHFLHFS